MTTHRAEIEADLERGPEELAAADPFWPAQLAVLAALALYVALPAVLIYAVAYWELDGGGATERGLGRRKPPWGFSFPQWVDVGWSHWRPMFVDYLYLSFTNCTAFSPTDTMPLRPSMKLLMLV